MDTVKFIIHRAPAFNGSLRPYTIFINGTPVGRVMNGGTMPLEGPAAPVYIVEKDGPFGTAVILRGKGRECPLEIRTAGGYGAPNGQDAIVRTGFWLGDRELREPVIYEKIRAARQNPAVRSALTEEEKPLFVAYAFWRAFGAMLEREDRVAFGTGMEGAMEALETIGAGEMAAFCRTVMGPDLAPGVYELPENRPDLRRCLTAAVHGYILEKGYN